MSRTEWECGKEDDHGQEEKGRQVLRNPGPNAFDRIEAMMRSIPFVALKNYDPGPPPLLFGYPIRWVSDGWRSMFRGVEPNGGCE